jgi:hypothetical protein
MDAERILKEFRLYAGADVSREALDFGEEMFVEWNGNETARLEARGFYAGCRATERIVLEEVRDTLLSTGSRAATLVRIERRLTELQEEKK